MHEVYIIVCVKIADSNINFSCTQENRKEKILTCDKLLCQKGLECIMRLKENGKKKGAMCRPIRRRDINPTTAPPPGDSETKGRRRRPVKPKM